MSIWKVGKDQYKDPVRALWVPSGWPVMDVIGANRWSTSSRNRPRLCAPGDTVLLSPRVRHRHFRVTHTYDEGAERDSQITVRAPHGEERAVIDRNPVGGSHTLYVEWGGGFTFQGLRILADDIAGFMTERPASDRWEGRHPGFRDLFLRDCVIDGEYDFTIDAGFKSKWGLLTYELGRSAYHGTAGFGVYDTRIQNIYHEHGGYLHNCLGAVTFQDCRFVRLGRSGLQFTWRTEEGPQGSGAILIQDSFFQDCGINDGTSAISIKGGFDGQIVLNRCKVLQGIHPRDLAPPYRENVTGALVVHEGGGSHPAKPEVAVIDSWFSMSGGKGSYRRPCVDVSHCKTFLLHRSKVFATEDSREALKIDADSIDNIKLTKDNIVQGDCTLRRNGEEKTWRVANDSIEGRRLPYKKLRLALYGPEGIENPERE